MAAQISSVLHTDQSALAPQSGPTRVSLLSQRPSATAAASAASSSASSPRAISTAPSNPSPQHHSRPVQHHALHSKSSSVSSVGPATPPAYNPAASASSSLAAVHSGFSNSPPAAPVNHAANSSSGTHPTHRPAAARRSISSLQSVANGTTMPTNTRIPAGPGMPNPQFDHSRSPPSSKNLNHVPCKFFRQGACQAGKACPFSHNQEPGSEQAPCKYFSKGNCKFGQKCALAHILPDGRRVNHRGHFGNNGHGGMQFGRMDPSSFNHRALHNGNLQHSLLANSVANHHPHHSPSHSLGGQEEFPALPGQPIPQMAESMAAAPVANSLPRTDYGSPHADQLFPTSPPLATSHRTDRTLGPLDAALPSSIDRIDYSHFAKYGPFASSVPDKFGIGFESPPPSLPRNGRGDGTTIQALHKTAYYENGDGTELSSSARLGDGESLGGRMMHSAVRRAGFGRQAYPNSYAGAQNHFSGFKDKERLSFGLAAGSDDLQFDDEFDNEQAEMLPASLQNDVLTPYEIAERNRRMSRTEDEASGSYRHNLIAPGTPGSPPIVGSPGSWGPIITRNKREDEPQIVSGVGHVGSPLRNSYLNTEISPIRGLPFNSAPRGSGISALTQGIKRASISEAEAAEPKHSPGPFKGLERTVSSPRVSNGTNTIDEEPETQFSLEVDEETPTRQVGGFGPSGTNGSQDAATGLGVDMKHSTQSRN